MSKFIQLSQGVASTKGHMVAFTIRGDMAKDWARLVLDLATKLDEACINTLEEQPESDTRRNTHPENFERQDS